MEDAGDRYTWTQGLLRCSIEPARHGVMENAGVVCREGAHHARLQLCRRAVQDASAYEQQQGRRKQGYGHKQQCHQKPAQW